MKVLNNNDYVKKVCPHCKSTLGIMCEDISYKDISMGMYVICAVCDRSIDIRDDEIPRRWLPIIFADCD